MMQQLMLMLSKPDGPSRLPSSKNSQSQWLREVECKQFEQFTFTDIPMILVVRKRFVVLNRNVWLHINQHFLLLICCALSLLYSSLMSCAEIFLDDQAPP